MTLIEISSGEQRECPQCLLEESKLIKNFILDTSIDQNTPIPLPNIDSETLECLISLLEDKEVYFKLFHENKDLFNSVFCSTSYLATDDLNSFLKVFVENHTEEACKNLCGGDHSVQVKKNTSRSDLLGAVRFNIQVIALTYYHHKERYKDEPFLLKYDLKTIKGKWDGGSTIRKKQIDAISYQDQTTGDILMIALNFTKEKECLSLFIDSETDNLNSHFVFINSYNTDIAQLSKISEKWEDFNNILLHCEPIFGKKKNRATYSFICGDTHLYCGRIYNLAKKHNFYYEKIQYYLRGCNSNKLNRCVVMIQEDTDELLSFCFYRVYKNNDLYIGFFFVSPEVQGNHFGSNFFNCIIENLAERPKFIYLESKNTEQARYFWFKKMDFSQIGGYNNFGKKRVTQEVVEKFLIGT